MRLIEREAQAEHARPALPGVDQRAALRAVEREVAEDRRADWGAARAASTASSLELGSQPGGWISAASTPASSISFNSSSVEKLVT